MERKSITSILFVRHFPFLDPDPEILIRCPNWIQIWINNTEAYSFINCIFFHFPGDVDELEVEREPGEEDSAEGEPRLLSCLRSLSQIFVHRYQNTEADIVVSDRHQNDADPDPTFIGCRECRSRSAPDPALSFTHVGKFEFFNLYAQ